MELKTVDKSYSPILHIPADIDTDTEVRILIANYNQPTRAKTLMEFFLYVALFFFRVLVFVFGRVVSVCCCVCSYL